MVKMIRNNWKPHRYIDVVIVFDPPYSESVAAARAKHPANLPESKRWSDTQLTFYNTFLDNAASEIQRYFKIFDENQSSESYSYYMTFDTNQAEWTVRYRIADHFKPRDRHKPLYNRNDNRRMLFRQIIIGPDKEFKSYTQALNAIKDMCEGIYNGDPDVISKSYEIPVD